MRFPAFDLPTADGGRLTDADLAGAPHYVYMARHPGCFVCQAKLAEVLERRDEVRALGGDVVLFFNAQVEYVTMWARKNREAGDIPADLTVVMDPDATLYEELGTVRSAMLGELTHTLGSLWRTKSHIRKWRLSGNDMLRMGADVGVAPDGEMVFRHICPGPEDRARPEDVIAALRGAVPAAA